MGKFEQFYDDFKVFRAENRDDHKDIVKKVEDLAGRVGKVEDVQLVCERRQGRLTKIWCAIIGAVGVVAGGLVSIFTTKA